MKRSRGFTLTELLITITIMGLLLAFATAGFSGSLARGRDDDRVSDITALTKRLESLYKVGITGSGWSVTQGSYPSAQQMGDSTKRDVIFQDINAASRIVYGTSPSTDSIVAPGSSDPLTFGDTTQAITVNQYAYIPIAIDASGNPILCWDSGTQDCRRFIFRYRLENEAGNPIHEVRSKNQ